MGRKAHWEKELETVRQNPNPSKKREGFDAFIKELFMTAEQDTPYEIAQWCKTAFCKNICAYLGIDINKYRREMTALSVKKFDSKSPDAHYGEDIAAKLYAEEKEEIQYGPLFCYNNRAYEEVL